MSSSTNPNTIKILSNPLSWRFFAEGAANILYICEDINDAENHGKLLRLRKGITGSSSTLEIAEFLDSQVRPELGQYYVSMTLVKLEASFLKHLVTEEEKDKENCALPNGGPIAVAKKVKSPKNDKRRFDTPINVKDEYGFLMENLVESRTKSSSLGRPNNIIKEYTLATGMESVLVLGFEETYRTIRLDEVIIEFKPKWLLPPPLPPAYAVGPETTSKVIRCRTCALAYQRNKKIPFICPLDIGFSDAATSNILSKLKQAEANLLSTVSQQLDIPSPNLQFPISQLLSNVLSSHSVFQHLQRLQARDTRGILAYSPTEALDNGFLVATAARDCTIFIRLWRESQNPSTCGSNTSSCDNGHTSKVEQYNVGGHPYNVSMTVTDVDMKTPTDAKRSYWRNIEDGLWRDNWYTRRDLPACRYYEIRRGV